METLAAFKETPLPAILVVAGLVFIFLGIGGRLSAGEIPPDKRRIIGIIGTVLFITGLGLFVVPTSTPVSSPTALSPTEAAQSRTTAIEPLELLPTATPRFVKRIAVPSNTDTGVTFHVSQAGKYTIQYVESAFSVWKDQPLEWSTGLCGFGGRPPEWASDNSMKAELALFCFGSAEHKSAQTAIDSTKGQKAIIRLDAGESLTLVAADLKNVYDDNAGDITVDIFFAP